MFDDHIVVESPGKLPGLVRADNIRFTHFSRNPKIAEFLKNYKFVKEFGEGVNRMCNELEQVGLKDPVYHTNAFMLQEVKGKYTFISDFNYVKKVNEASINH